MRKIDEKGNGLARKREREVEKKVEFRPLPLAPRWHLFSAEARGVEVGREELW